MKPRTDLLPAGALLEVAAVMAHGAAKHGERGWGERLFGEDYAAALRHLLRWWQGEERCPQTGCSHLAHAAARVLILLDRQGSSPEIDDRPAAGEPASRVQPNGYWLFDGLGRFVPRRRAGKPVR